MTNAKLIASYHTLAGPLDPLGPEEAMFSSLPFEDRALAAAQAGFQGIGLSHVDLEHILQTSSLREIRSVLEVYRLVLELEFLVDWFADGERLANADDRARMLLTAAEVLGAMHIKIGGDQDGADWPFDAMVAGFRRVCGLAAAAGTKVVLELMPWSNLRTLEQGANLVGEAGQPNGSLLLDVWHMARGGVAMSDIALLPGGVIGHVEVCDALACQRGTVIEDTTLHRRLCGEGELDLAGFLEALRQAEYSGSFGVEVLSIEQRRRASDLAARVAHDTALASISAVFHKPSLF